MANNTREKVQVNKGKKYKHLIGKNIRSIIYNSRYWKEECVALTVDNLVNQAKKLMFIGGISGKEPTPFLCLILRMIEIQPKKKIVVEFIRNEEFKYVRALGALYMRLAGTTKDFRKYLEPLSSDNRRLSRQDDPSQFVVVYMDDFIDEILKDELVCDVILPCIQVRNRALIQDCSNITFRKARRW